MKNKEAKEECIMDSEFIPLEDLVYAPLYALAKSNHQLRTHIVEAIKDMGRVEQSNKEEIVHLKNINIAYDQVKQEADGYSVDNLQVQVPLLSIVPMHQLNVDKAEVEFSTEVKLVEDKENNGARIHARVCAPSQRETDFLPKISYKLQVTSLPATESILRLMDSLSSNPLAKNLNTRPIALTGDWGSEEQKQVIQETKKLKAKVSRLRQLYQKISDLINEQEQLKELSNEHFEDATYDFDKEKYQMAQANIVNRIMEYEGKIMNMEIQFGLDYDYE